MPVSRRFFQHMHHPGFEAVDRVRRDPELRRDPVGGPKPNAANLAGQPKRVLPHHRDRLLAEFPVDPRGMSGAHPVTLEKNHDLPHALLLDPGFLDPARPFRPDPFHLAQPGGEPIDHLERPLAKMIDYPLGKLAANPRHQAAAQVFPDPDHRPWQDRIIVLHGKLRAEFWMGPPLAAGADRFADVQRGEVANDRDRLGAAAPFR